MWLKKRLKMFCLWEHWLEEYIVEKEDASNVVDSARGITVRHGKHWDMMPTILTALGKL